LPEAEHRALFHITVPWVYLATYSGYPETHRSMGIVKRRLCLKGPAETPKRPRAEAAGNATANASGHEEKEEAGVSSATERGAVVPLVSPGCGRGLKAVQLSKNISSNKARPDGSTHDAKSKVKEQKLFTVKGNVHVETKTLTEDRRKSRQKDGTIVSIESTTVKKVCYM
jgi:hypothetical protein